jgi:hypothetical protein
MYGAGGSHRPSVGSDFDGRPHSGSGLQSYYQNQRYGPRQGEQGQMEQAKRRMAAQRERELRNYHQEQQYAKTMTGPKSDRSMSPNTGMSEEERRELIARQHRALYGNDSTLYTPDKGSRPSSQDARNVGAAMGVRGGSPLAYDPFGMQAQGGVVGSEGTVQMPARDHNKDGSGVSRSRANSTSSPASNQNPTFGMFENAQQSSRTSNSSPTGGSPPGSGNKGAGASGVAPIGTRPAASQAPIQGLQKRSTTPLPSPLSYGFSASDQAANERSTSASSNPSSNVQEKGNVGLGWGSNSGVWGTSKGGLSVQASVWG